jgi:biopolymer transport protein ExbB/TolQ
MDTLIHADIFFFITAIAVVLLTILLIIAFFYIIQILRNMRDFSDTLRREGNLIASDIAEFREQVKNDRVKAFSALRLVSVMFGRLFRQSTKRRSEQEHSKRRHHEEKRSDEENDREKK